MSYLSESRTVDDFVKNFPFQTLRERQSHVLNEIATGFASGSKYIVLEAPTGFSKKSCSSRCSTDFRQKLHMYQHE